MFCGVFAIASNTVSCARNGTSVQVLPSESTIVSISIMLVSCKRILSNLLAEPNENDCVFTVPAIAGTDFLIKKYLEEHDSLPKFVFENWIKNENKS